MAFVLKQSDTFFWPVSFDVPENGGKHRRQTFDAEFRRLPQSRLKELGELLGQNEISDSDAVAEMLCGWRGVTDDQGEEIPFSDGMMRQLLDVPFMAATIFDAYTDSLQGAKRKN